MISLISSLPISLLGRENRCSLTFKVVVVLSPPPAVSIKFLVFFRPVSELGGKKLVNS